MPTGPPKLSIVVSRAVCVARDARGFIESHDYPSGQTVASNVPFTVVPTTGESVSVPETEPRIRSALTGVSDSCTFDVLGPAASCTASPVPGFE